MHDWQYASQGFSSYGMHSNMACMRLCRCSHIQNMDQHTKQVLHKSVRRQGRGTGHLRKGFAKYCACNVFGTHRLCSAFGTHRLCSAFCRRSLCSAFGTYTAHAAHSARTAYAAHSADAPRSPLPAPSHEQRNRLLGHDRLAALARCAASCGGRTAFGGGGGGAT